MHFLTADESRQWARRHGVTLNEAFGHPIASEVASPLRFRIPEDAGARVALARMLWDCWLLPADSRPAVFVSHDEYGVVDPRGDDRGLQRRLQALGVLADRTQAI